MKWFPVLMLGILAACPQPADDDSAADDDSVADDDDSSGPDPETVPLAGPCDSDVRVGGFVVTAGTSYSMVTGQVREDVVPNTVLDEVGSYGDCVLLLKHNPVCTPACQPDQACTVGNECVPFPLALDLGTVTVEGLALPSSMEPTPPGNEYYDTSQPHPAFADGALVRLRAGDLELYGVGGPSLAGATAAWEVQAGTPVALAWPAAGPPARARVLASLNVDQHGLTPVTVYCSFEDDGSAEIPAGAVDALLGFGISGFPSARLARRTLDHGSIDEGCVDFSVGWELPATVAVSR